MGPGQELFVWLRLSLAKLAAGLGRSPRCQKSGECGVLFIFLLLRIRRCHAEGRSARKSQGAGLVFFGSRKLFIAFDAE